MTTPHGRTQGAHSTARGARLCAPYDDAHLHRPNRSLASFVAQFKATASRRINALRDTQGARVWQRNFYEHIVRDEDDFSRIQTYIEGNPRRWPDDEYHP